jgi:CheY-like chemotaxis protein
MLPSHSMVTKRLQVLARWPVNLVLLDLIMPGVDGWSFLRKLARHADTDQPVVLVWSVVEGDALARARSLGAAECLRRETTDPDGLLEAIARLLAAARCAPSCNAYLPAA